MSEGNSLSVRYPRKARLISALIVTGLGIQAVISIVSPPKGPFEATRPFAATECTVVPITKATLSPIA